MGYNRDAAGNGTHKDQDVGPATRDQQKTNHINGNGARSHLASTMRPINRNVSLSERRFDVDTLPPDMRRVYGHLEEKFGEEYGLLIMFVMRTAIELHRAWHMTLLTSKILQQVKDEFGLRTTWDLGVIRIKFRVEDGGYELHRRVAYDYDSEYQDIYYRIAVALIERQITVHEALLYQSEAKAGLHTASSGLFLRDFPGRLVLYPFLAATCAVIFFDGKWIDAGVAAICGVASGLIDYALSYTGGQAKVLTDVTVGVTVGVIGGLWYDHVKHICLSGIFLGALYWFFYGTAFVIGLLEIIAGELETGVTRFVGVSVKTFVLSLGAAIGLMMSHGGGARDVWMESEEYCDKDFVKGQWWRIPLYLLCSVAVLGQYRLPIDRYIAALIIQLVAYEVQYSVDDAIAEEYTLDNLDTAASNMTGAAAAVLAACSVSWIGNKCRNFYSARLLQQDEEHSCLSNAVYHYMRCTIKAFSCLRVGRNSDVKKFDMARRLREQKRELEDPGHPRDRISLPQQDENLFIEAIVGAQEVNIWAILMPAVYQLVPGSIIARLWFHAIFPPEPGSETSQESVFSSLMVISTSLALGLIFGFAIVQSFTMFLELLVGSCKKERDEDQIATMKRKHDMLEGMWTASPCPEDDPGSIHPVEDQRYTNNS